MKTKTIAIVSASLLALGAAAWAADQNQSPTNDLSSGYSQSSGGYNQSPAYNQTPPSNYQGGTAYDYRGQYAPYYGCGWGGSAYQGQVQAAPGYAPQGFWHRCGRWFGWHHRAQGGTVAYSGCCQ